MHKGKEYETISQISSNKESKLDISNNLLKDLSGIDKFGNDLTWLNVSHNKITDVSQIKGCPKLNVLNLGYNGISSVEEIGEIKGLKALILNNNKLKSLEGLDTLSQLNTLVVSHNELEEIDVNGFPDLQKFTASHNQLTNVPDIQNNKSMKDVKLNDNKISSLPNWLTQCKRIRVLDLGNNQLSTLSSIECLKDLPSLENLNLKGNPLCETEQYYTKMKKMLPSLKVLDYKKLTEMYYKELQQQPKKEIKPKEEETKSKDTGVAETKNRGFVSKKLKSEESEQKEEPAVKKKKKIKKGHNEPKNVTERNEDETDVIDKSVTEILDKQNSDVKKVEKTKRKLKEKIVTEDINTTEDAEQIPEKKKAEEKSETKQEKKDKRSGVVSVKKIKTGKKPSAQTDILFSVNSQLSIGAGLNSAW